MIRDLVTGNRTFRRFRQDEPISRETLVELVDLARRSGSAGNVQPLKYRLVCDPETNAKVFPHLGWAGYLKDWPGPGEGERPAAYIVVLGDTQIASSYETDLGIACQSILLGATERGLGGCMIGAGDMKAVGRALDLPDRYEVALVIALGRPKEQVVLETVGDDGDVRYWRDSDGMHHVPKRPLAKIIV